MEKKSIYPNIHLKKVKYLLDLNYIFLFNLNIINDILKLKIKN